MVDHLNLLDKDEWREVCRKMRPDWTDEQFEEKWNEFQEIKRNKGLSYPINTTPSSPPVAEPRPQDEAAG